MVKMNIEYQELVKSEEHGVISQCELANIIQRNRTKRRRTREQLAVLTGKSPGTIVNWEDQTGLGTMPSADSLLSLCQEGALGRDFLRDVLVFAGIQLSEDTIEPINDEKAVIQGLCETISALTTLRANGDKQKISGQLRSAIELLEGICCHIDSCIAFNKQPGR